MPGNYLVPVAAQKAKHRQCGKKPRNFMFENNTFPNNTGQLDTWAKEAQTA
jgi:hypothetical protein